MTERSYTFFDRAIGHLDQTLKTLVPGSSTASRPNPAKGKLTQGLSDADRKHIAGLMRINHTGEVCAQALYQGQALTARNQQVQQNMQQCADEEVDHLAWCEERLKQLNSQPSLLNPAFYAMSLGIGAAAGLVGDKVSLGFVAATEDQVCLHLEDHLRQIPESDQKSRAILEQMLVDEASHASKALNEGGIPFPPPVKKAMTVMSKVMTASTYRI